VRKPMSNNPKKKKKKKKNSKEEDDEEEIEDYIQYKMALGEDI